MYNEEIEEYIIELLNYNDKFKMWIESNRKFILTPKKKEFGKIKIIDFFNDKEPTLIDQEFISNGIGKVIMLPSFVLDSNVVGALHGFVTDSKLIGRELKEDAKSFINSLIVEKIDGLVVKENERFYDINPFFYVLECILKKVDSIYVIDCLKSIIKLQMLDYKKFKESNGKCLEKDLSLEEESLIKHGSFDIDIIAKNTYESIALDKKAIEGFKDTVNYIYLLLLKIAQVNLYEINKTPVEKIDIVKNYYSNEIGLFSAREINIAIYYLNNNIGSFIPINKKSTDELLHGIYNSAIDISLLRMSEFFLHLGDRSKINSLIYPVTIEKHLIKIGNACNFKSLYSLGDKFYTLFDFDMSMIEKSKDYDRIINCSEYFDEKTFLKRFSKELLKPEFIESKVRDIELSIIQIKSLKDKM